MASPMPKPTIPCSQRGELNTRLLPGIIHVKHSEEHNYDIMKAQCHACDTLNMQGQNYTILLAVNYQSPLISMQLPLSISLSEESCVSQQTFRNT